MIAIMLRLVARPEKREELARHIRDRMLGPTRQEPGCIRYRFYQDIEDPNAFSFVEHWDHPSSTRTPGEHDGHANR